MKENREIATTQTKKEEQVEYAKETKKEERTIITKIFMNHSELNYSDDYGVVFSKHPERILIPERFMRRGKSRADLLLLPSSFTNSLEGINIKLKNKHPPSEIVRFLQFGKGTVLTKPQLEGTYRAEEGADINLLYERSREQKVEEYKKQLEYFYEIAKKKKAVVLEIESRSIELKIAEALKIGIKDFYIIAGKYDDIKRWRELVVYPIKQGKGRSTAVLLKRYKNKDKRAYIIDMLDAGVDHIVHGGLYSPPVKDDFEIVFLDFDGIYKEASEVKDKSLLSTIEKCPENKLYSLSRALAINKANNIAKTRKLQPVIKK